MISLTFEEARAEAQLLDVAMSHALLIKMFRFVFNSSANLHLRFYFNSCARFGHPSLFNSMFLLHCCSPHTRPAEAISVSARKLIKSMFLGHPFDVAAGGGFTYVSSPSGALDGEDGYVMKLTPLHVLHRHDCPYFCFLDASSIEESVEEHLGQEKETLQKEHKSALFLRHCWLGLCPGWLPPRAIFIVGHNFVNHVSWISVGGRIYTPCRTAIGGFPRRPRADFAGFVRFMNISRFLQFLRATSGLPEGSLGPVGFVESR